MGTLIANHNGINPLLAVAISIVLGAALGVVNGVIVAWGRVPAVVVTLGTLAIYRGVLVDLSLTPDAGGHVKCWERIAEAAVGCGDRLDLTVHFNGPAGSAGPRRIELSPNVRYVLMPPVFSSRRLVRQVPDHTDLAPWHPGLSRALQNYDVIHTTDAFFCYARTATRFASHETPRLARVTAA